MLNRAQPPGGDEAVVRYEDSDFTMLKSGRYVRCAVTGAPIPIEELRYWSVDRQEAYASADIALQRWRMTDGTRG
ncbi:MAG: DUF2093 domain-containing protein [Caulobacterales bacterium]|jgi:hypothetical protein